MLTTRRVPLAQKHNRVHACVPACVHASPKPPKHSSPFQSAPVEYCNNSAWRQELSVPGSVVALGKFDAMHIGHRELAVRAASTGGFPFLVSFSGMAEVLGWPERQPLVAEPDRGRILRSWAPLCGGLCPRQRFLPFSNIRSMSPEEFVQYLCRDLQAIGVVAGSNYRFGYRAAGDAETLQQLGRQYGMQVEIVDLVGQDLHGGPLVQVSSSRARSALDEGRLDLVTQYLDRRYRLVLDVDPTKARLVDGALLLPRSASLNMLPGCGSYRAAARVVHTRAAIDDCPDEGAGASVEVQVQESGVAVPAELLWEPLLARKGFGYLLLDME